MLDYEVATAFRNQKAIEQSYEMIAVKNKDSLSKISC